MIEAISILISTAIGVLLVLAADPVRALRPRWAAALFRAALGAGVGMGLTSTLCSLATMAGAGAAYSAFLVDAVALAMAAALFLRSRKRQPDEALPAIDHPRKYAWNWLLASALAVLAVLLCARLVQIVAAAPYGQWDAFAIWNIRAKFLAGPADSWKFAVSSAFDRSHPDYPLLLSGYVARIWKESGGSAAIAPVMTAFLILGALIALLVGGLALLRGAASAFLAAFVLLSTTPLLLLATAQYADLLLAFYILAAATLLLVDSFGEPEAKAPLVWAGIAAGFAAWTKNEGIVFLLGILIVFFAVEWRQKGTARAIGRGRLLFAGALPGLLLIVWFKFFLAPAAEPLVKQGLGGMLTKLADAARYVEIAKALGMEIWRLGTGASHPLLLLAILAILLRWQPDLKLRAPSTVAASLLALMLLSYCGAYLVTPSDLKWHLNTSFDRLILQVWPLAVLLCFTHLGRVADAPAPTAPPAAAPASGKRRRK